MIHKLCPNVYFYGTPIYSSLPIYYRSNLFYFGNITNVIINLSYGKCYELINNMNKLNTNLLGYMTASESTSVSTRLVG